MNYIVYSNSPVSALCAKVYSLYDWQDGDHKIVIQKFVNEFNLDNINHGDKLIFVGYSYTGSHSQLSFINRVAKVTSDYVFLFTGQESGLDTNNIFIFKNSSSLLEAVFDSCDVSFKEEYLEQLYLFDHNNFENLEVRLLIPIIGCLKFSSICNNYYSSVPVTKEGNSIVFENIGKETITQWYMTSFIIPIKNTPEYKLGRMLSFTGAKVFALNSDIDITSFKLAWFDKLKTKYDLFIQPTGFDVSRGTTVILVIPVNSPDYGILSKNNKNITNLLEKLGFYNSKVNSYSGYAIMSTKFSDLFEGE